METLRDRPARKQVRDQAGEHLPSSLGVPVVGRSVAGVDLPPLPAEVREARRSREIPQRGGVPWLLPGPALRRTGVDGPGHPALSADNRAVPGTLNGSPGGASGNWGGEPAGGRRGPRPPAGNGGASGPSRRDGASPCRPALNRSICYLVGDDHQFWSPAQDRGVLPWANCTPSVRCLHGDPRFHRRLEAPIPLRPRVEALPARSGRGEGAEAPPPCPGITCRPGSGPGSRWDSNPPALRSSAPGRPPSPPDGWGNIPLVGLIRDTIRVSGFQARRPVRRQRRG